MVQTSRSLPAYFSSGRTYLFLPQESLYPSVSGRLHDILRMPLRRGAHMGHSQISGTWTCLDHQLHINCLELKAVIAALNHWVSVLQSHQVLIAMDNTTVVSHNQQTRRDHSPTLLRLVVDLFMWLQTQDIVLRARHILGCLNVIADPLSRPNQPISTEWSLHSKIVKQSFDFWGTPAVDMFAMVHTPTCLSSCL